jgi:hypothetical protein
LADDKKTVTSIPWTPELIKEYFDRALPALNTENFTTSSEWVDLLVNQCLAEKHWSEAFTHFLKEVRRLGLEIETDQRSFEQMTEKLFKFRSIRTFIQALSLGPYEEEIMKYEIARAYGNVIIPPPPDPIKKEHVSATRPPRKIRRPKSNIVPTPPRPAAGQVAGPNKVPNRTDPRK